MFYFTSTILEAPFLQIASSGFPTITFIFLVSSFISFYFSFRLQNHSLLIETDTSCFFFFRKSITLNSLKSSINFQFWISKKIITKTYIDSWHNICFREFLLFLGNIYSQFASFFIFMQNQKIKLEKNEKLKVPT